MAKDGVCEKCTPKSRGNLEAWGWCGNDLPWELCKPGGEISELPVKEYTRLKADQAENRPACPPVLQGLLFKYFPLEKTLFHTKEGRVVLRNLFLCCARLGLQEYIPT